jgi:hypothetical protein
MTRRGSGLIEVLVALPLIVLLGAVAVQLLLTVHQQVLRHDGTLGATRELRHGAGILAADARTARARDVIAWSDTAVEFEATVGVGYVCGTGAAGDAVTVVNHMVDPLGTASDEPDPISAIWNQPPQPGDRARLWLTGLSPLDSGAVQERLVRSVDGGTECAASPLHATGAIATTRLAFTDSSTRPVRYGAPVRVTRRTRYSLYRASDGDWFLGRRTRGLVGWDVVQPVAGPLSSAGNRGLRLTMYDRTGAAVSTGAGVPARLRIELRAPRRAGRAAPSLMLIDSISIDVVFRADIGVGA